MALGKDALLVRAGKVVDDDWQHVEDGDAIPATGPVTISWARWLAERDMIARAPAELGVRAANTVQADEIGADANHFALILLAFPSFSDGRAFSQARIVRGRHEFRGEIRATGNVLRDQLQFMQRCGFDAFEVPQRAIAEDWFSALGEFDLFYQPTEDNRPWIARQRTGRN